MMNRCKTINICLVTIAIYLGFAVHAQAITLTFDEGTFGSSAETFYQADYGVTFSGGGLLSEGAEGGMPGQPVFTFLNNFPGRSIGTQSKDSSGNYADSYFDMWINFSEDVFSVSGDCVTSSRSGETVYAYDAYGALLDSIYFDPALTADPLSVWTLGTFDFETTTAISKIHMISDHPTIGVNLDNLTFPTAPVPEPTTLFLLGTGLIGIMGSRKKFKK